MQVSCIIPTKDRCRMALEAIASVLAQQECDPPEVILVDYSSSDSTVASTACMFPQVKIIRGPGLGPGRARNAGAAAASGDILMFLDSDDLWFSHHTHALLRSVRQGYPVAYGIARVIDEVHGGEFTTPQDMQHGKEDCFRQLLRWCFLAPSAAAISREAFAAVGGFSDEPFGEDWIFFLKLAALFPFGFAAGAPVTLCRLHRQSLGCFTDSSMIIRLIRGIINLLSSGTRAGSADIARFMRMEEFVRTRGASWISSRDWYLAMKEQEMI